jgi:hypothetical protein
MVWYIYIYIYIWYFNFNPTSIIYYLAFMRHAGVKSVVQTVAFEVDILGYAIIEWIITEIITVQLAW